MNRQQTFDRVVSHLLCQNAKAAKFKPGERPRCMYRAPDGKKCAVGCLIPDELYSPSLEGATVRNTPVQQALGQPIRHDDIGFLTSLQAIHDHGEIADWPAQLGDIARIYLLSTFVLRNCLRFWTPPAQEIVP